jgi:preprotein translocase subunit SecG
VTFPLAMLSQYIFGPSLFLLSLFIILIILLQRGRGGGLTGALGGAGGASAFGVKAGDIFTRITAVSVLVWIILCALTCYWYLPPSLDIASDPGSMSAGPSGASGVGAGGMGGSLENDLPLPTGDSVAPPVPSNSAPAGTNTPASETPPSSANPAGNTAPAQPSVEQTATEKPKLDLPPAVNEPTNPSVPAAGETKQP